MNSLISSRLGKIDSVDIFIQWTRNHVSNSSGIVHVAADFSMHVHSKAHSVYIIKLLRLGEFSDWSM